MDINEFKHESAEHQAADHSDNQALITCIAERDSWKEKYLYARADLDNVQRRMAKDSQRIIWDSQAKILKELIDLMDDFDRALSLQEASQQREGLILMHKQLAKILEQAGVEEIKGQQAFDPELHEAVEQVADTGHESGTIIIVLQKGYQFKGQLLRPARVSVAQ